MGENPPIFQPEPGKIRRFVEFILDARESNREKKTDYFSLRASSQPTSQGLFSQRAAA